MTYRNDRVMIFIDGSNMYHSLEKHIKSDDDSPSGADTFSRIVSSGPIRNVAGQCPDCGGILAYQEGCFKCPACGYTKC